MVEHLKDDTGTVHVLHAVATADGPVTAEEVAEVLDGDVNNVKTSLLRLCKSGLALRRRRPGANEGRVQNPFEYVVAPREIETEEDNE